MKTARFISPSDFRSILKPRPKESHKGTWGHLLLVGGSINRLGAPLLSAWAALRSGAGLVTLALPDRCYRKIPRGLLEVMYEPLPSTARGGFSRRASAPLKVLLKEKRAVAAGPGLGTTADVRSLVVTLVQHCPLPLVLDADAINLLAGETEILKKRSGPVILTPHPGEMGRLIGRTAAQVQKDRLRIASSFAKTHHVFVVLKGFHTVVATPKGSCFINLTGNPGMATAGMGDVLTGMIGALAAAYPLEEAILAAVYIHGLAGDRVAKRLGGRGLLASDVIEEIPRVSKDLGTTFKQPSIA